MRRWLNDSFRTGRTLTRRTWPEACGDVTSLWRHAPTRRLPMWTFGSERHVSRRKSLKVSAISLADFGASQKCSCTSRRYSIAVLARSMAESTRPPAGANLPLAAVKSVGNIVENIILFSCFWVGFLTLKMFDLFNLNVTWIFRALEFSLWQTVKFLPWQPAFVGITRIL